MKVGVVVYSDDPETVWNAFRYANFAQALKDEVTVFLLGRGVESDIVGTEKFNVAEQIECFVLDGGTVYACGTCLKIHGKEPALGFIVATMNELYEIIRDSDRVVSF